LIRETLQGLDPALANRLSDGGIKLFPLSSNWFLLPLLALNGSIPTTHAEILQKALGRTCRVEDATTNAGVASKLRKMMDESGFLGLESQMMMSLKTRAPLLFVSSIVGPLVDDLEDIVKTALLEAQSASADQSEKEALVQLMDEVILEAQGLSSRLSVQVADVGRRVQSLLHPKLSTLPGRMQSRVNLLASQPPQQFVTPGEATASATVLVNQMILAISQDLDMEQRCALDTINDEFLQAFSALAEQGRIHALQLVHSKLRPRFPELANQLESRFAVRAHEAHGYIGSGRDAQDADPASNGRDALVQACQQTVEVTVKVKGVKYHAPTFRTTKDEAKAEHSYVPLFTMPLHERNVTEREVVDQKARMEVFEKDDKQKRYEVRPDTLTALLSTRITEMCDKLNANVKSTTTSAIQRLDEDVSKAALEGLKSLREAASAEANRAKESVEAKLARQALLRQVIADADALRQRLLLPPSELVDAFSS
jgi:hypothetical protein